MRCGRPPGVIFEGSDAGDHRIAGVMCSFCGETIAPGEIDPVELRITARADRPDPDGFGVQLSWCHATCLEASGLGDLHVTRPEYRHSDE
jgi:hypothetical protein